MKRWTSLRSHLLTGEWHVHTTYTDGLSTVSELCERASQLRIPLLAFTEHVRRDITYDFDRFAREVREAAKAYNLHALVGCEAKILEGGALDAPDSVLESCEYVLAAVHSFAGGVALYQRSVQVALGDSRVSGWAHPGAFPARIGATVDVDWLEDLFAQMRRNSVLLEVNCRRNCPPASWMEAVRTSGVALVRGSDVHSCRELLGVLRGKDSSAAVEGANVAEDCPGITSSRCTVPWK